MTENVNIINHIKKCEQVINERNATKAKELRNELTLIYSRLIPRWNVGLMAFATELYHDDIEVIRKKLIEFKDKQA